MQPSSDPVVSFGLRALAAAMDAKSCCLQRGAALVLSAARARDLPGDQDAADACAQFAVLAAVDQPGAGRFLHDWLTGWRGGVAPRHAWQDRVDLR